MAIRMQQRRGTEEQWTLANPTLAAGEIGFETNTGKFKIGDGVNRWNTLAYYLSDDALEESLDDYIPLSAAGVSIATLDVNGQVPADQLGNATVDLSEYALASDVTSAVNSAVSSLVDSAPEVLDTLNELAAAIGDDANFITTINTSISNGDAATLSAAEDYTDAAIAAIPAPDFTGLATEDYVDTAIEAIPLPDLSTKADLVEGFVDPSQLNNIMTEALSPIYVAISQSDITYSADGVAWTSASLPTSALWEDVAYGNGKFVIVSYYDPDYGSSNIAAYSADGVNWTETTLPSSSSWKSVTFGNGKFVAVAQNSSISAYSTDGINWTQSSLPISATWASVTYGNGRFVTTVIGSDTAVYSTDGITWTQTSLPMVQNWRAVAYGNDKFVAIARGGMGGSDVAAYSTDGITWTQTSIPNGGWSAVAYGNDKFVAISQGGGMMGSSVAAYSTDGINWTQSSLPINAFWASVTYGNGRFVAVPESSSVAAYSTDGIDWTQTTLSSSSNRKSVTFGDAMASISAPIASESYVDNAISAIPAPDFTGLATEDYVDAAILSAIINLDGGNA